MRLLPTLLALLTTLSLTICPVGLEAQAQQSPFQDFALTHRLSSPNVFAILQDRQGFLWFGTEDGLNRFDGYSFKVFQHDPGDPASLSHNWIWSLYEDRAGTLWVGTYGGGLNRFDAATEGFTRYSLANDLEGGAGEGVAKVIYEDPTGRLWVGTEQGLYQYDRANDTFSLFSSQSLIFGDAILALHQDRRGILWVGTLVALVQIDPTTGRIQTYRQPGGFVTSLLETPSGVLWMTRGGILYTVDPETGTSTPKPYWDDGAYTPDGAVGLYAPNPAEGFWLRTIKSLYWYDYDAERFVRYFHEPNAQNSSNLALEALYQDHSGVLWLG